MLSSVSDKTPEPLSQFTSQPLGCTVSCYPLSLTKRLNLSLNLLHSLLAVLYHATLCLWQNAWTSLSIYFTASLGCTVSCYPLSLTKRLNLSLNLLHSLLAVTVSCYPLSLTKRLNLSPNLLHSLLAVLYHATLSLTKRLNLSPNLLHSLSAVLYHATLQSLTKRLNLSLNLLHSLWAVLYHATLCLWQNAWTSLSIYFTASWLYCIMLSSVSDKTPEPLSQFTSQPLGCTVSCYPLSLTKRLNLSLNLLHSLLAVLYHATLCLWQNAWTSLLIYFTASWLYCIMLPSVSDKTPEPLSQFTSQPLLAVLYHATLCLWQNAWTSLLQFTSQPLSPSIYFTGCTVSCYPLSLTKRLNLSPNLLHSLSWLYCIMLSSVSDKTPEPLS